MKKSTGVNLKKFRRWLLENVGEKCEVYCVGCLICDAWQCYEMLESLVDFPDYEKNNEKTKKTS